MKKIFLVFEDYAEMSRTQTYLKKIGFDVMAVQHEARLADNLLSFNPDIVIAHGVNKFTGLQIGQLIKESTKYTGKVIIVLAHGHRPDVANLAKIRMDVLVEAPIQPPKLIQAIAKLVQMDPVHLLEKFDKAQLHEAGFQPPPAIQNEKPISQEAQRVKGYDKFLKGIQFDKAQSSHNKQTVKEHQAELKKGWNIQFLEEIDKLKRQFAAALFRKKH